MNFLPLLVVATCIVCEVAQAQDEAAPSRGLLKRGLLAKGKQTTTTTTPAPQEAEYEEDYAEGEEEAPDPSTESPPSSTEGKKLVAGGVRPFRSNTDLLEALKRRRAQAAQAKLQGQSTVAGAHATPTQAQTSPVEPAAAPAKSTYSKKRFSTTKETQNEEASAPVAAKPSRGRFGRPVDRDVRNAPAPAPISAGKTFPRKPTN